MSVRTTAVPSAIGAFKIKAGLGELLPAPSPTERGAKGGRGKKASKADLPAFTRPTISAYRKMAAHKDKLEAYVDSTDDVPTPTQRRCFCLQCQRTPLPGRWHCEYHERLNHEASLRASQPKTSRCRIGACLDPRLPEVSGCEACQRIGIERRKAEQAKQLAGSVPNTRLGSELKEATS